jgi:glycosyltransferase involved in cell wall biosynthesis
MKIHTRDSATPHLVWVYPDTLHDKLDAATWLNTTHELRSAGWTVDLLAPGPATLHEIRGVRVTPILRPEIYLLRQVLFHINVLRYLWQRRSAVDVVLFHQMSAPWLLPLRLLRRLAGSRSPQLVMDIRTLHMEPQQGESIKARLRRWLNEISHRAANRWADGQTAITERMAAALKIRPDQLWGVWPSGVTQEHFSSAQQRRRWPSAEEPIHLIYIGSLHYERNLMNLCRAVEEANHQAWRFRLSLIGDGTERPDLEQFARQTHGRIHVGTPVPHQQVPDLLAEAHVGLLPFPDEEKFRVSSPIKLFEYMAAGLPIMATRIACHTDVVGDGSYLFWAEDSSREELLNALWQIEAARHNLPQMSRQSAAAASKWTWAQAARKLQSALEEHLSKPEQQTATVERTR